MSSYGMAGETGALGMIREGMPVFDAAGARVGTVRTVVPGSGGDPADARQSAREAIADVDRATRPDEPTMGTGNIAAVGVGGLSGDGGHPIGPLTGAAAYDPNDPDRRVAEGVMGAQIPDDARAGDPRTALAGEGYIQIDSAGLFASDRFAGARQIAGVGADGVRLSVRGDALMEDR